MSYGSWDLQLPVHITTKVVSSNPARGKVFWLQLYVIKVYQRLVAGQWLLWERLFLLHQYNWQPQYEWNIVEGGAKYHNPNPIQYTHIYIYIHVVYLLFWDQTIFENTSKIWWWHQTLMLPYYNQRHIRTQYDWLTNWFIVV